MQADEKAIPLLGPNYQTYDPLTGAVQGSRILRQPLSGNVIPASRLSQVSKNYLQFYPLPNQAGSADSNNNYLANSVRRDTFNGELGQAGLQP